MVDALGFRGKFAVIAPSTNTSVQPDFDDMRAFLTQLIPAKIENAIICRVLRNIWVTPPPRQ